MQMSRGVAWRGELPGFPVVAFGLWTGGRWFEPNGRGDRESCTWDS
jgi:hypothetical protein